MYDVLRIIFPYVIGLFASSWLLLSGTGVPSVHIHGDNPAGLPRMGFVCQL